MAKYVDEIDSYASVLDNETAEEIYGVETPIEEPTPEAGYEDYINVDPVEYDYAGRTSQLQDEMGVKGYISPEATVSGQLNTLLKQDSPYMKLAESKAREAANRKGLLSSSMAVGAGHRAAIETALPIATKDAATYAQRDLKTQEQIGASVLSSQQAEEALRADVQKFGLEGALAKMAAYDNLRALTLQGEINFRIEQLGQTSQDRRFEYEQVVKQKLQAMELDADTRKSFNDNIAEIGAQYSADLGAILRDPNFANETERQTAVKLLERDYVKNINFLASSADVDIVWGDISTLDDQGSGSTITQNEDGTVTVTTGTSGGTVTVKGSGAGGGDVNPDNTAAGSDLKTEVTGSDGNTLSGKTSVAYADMLDKDYISYGNFNIDLKSTNVLGSDEWYSFDSLKFYEHKYGREGGGGDGFEWTDGTHFSKVVRTELNQDQKWDIYSKILFAALNPDNADAQAQAKSVSTLHMLPGNEWMGLEGKPKVEYIDPVSIPPSERGEMSLVQKWINKYLYNNTPQGGYLESYTPKTYGGGSSGSDASDGGEGF